MRLIGEIIEILSSNEVNLATALLKTKVLLFQLGEKEPMGWVNNELKGYASEDNLPSYRILNVVVKGNITNMVYRYQSLVLPTMHLDKKYQDRLTKQYLMESIAVVEQYTNQKDLQITVAPEFHHLLSKGFDSSYHVEHAWGIHSAGAMTQVLTEVTTRLLDFLLDLSERFPEEMAPDEMKTRAKEVGVSDIFNNTVFGDNATIVVGDSNSQNTQNTVVKNDMDSLFQELINNKVSEEDITQLREAITIDADSEEVASGKIGKKVTKWIGTMVAKAVDTTWKVNVGAASGLLASAVSKYYGFT